MYLSNLLLPAHLVSKVVIVSDKGEVKGHLTVSVRPIPGELDSRQEPTHHVPSHYPPHPLSLPLSRIDSEIDEQVLNKSAKIEFGSAAAVSPNHQNVSFSSSLLHTPLPSPPFSPTARRGPTDLNAEAECPEGLTRGAWGEPGQPGTERALQ